MPLSFCAFRSCFSFFIALSKLIAVIFLWIWFNRLLHWLIISLRSKNPIETVIFRLYTDYINGAFRSQSLFRWILSGRLAPTIISRTIRNVCIINFCLGSEFAGDPACGPCNDDDLCTISLVPFIFSSGNQEKMCKMSEVMCVVFIWPLI